MPAPERTPPAQPYSLAINPLRGIVGYYSADEIDDILADVADLSPSQPITGHAGATPQPTAATPQALEDAFKDYADGLHYFDVSGALVAIKRQQYQTTIVMNGPVRSVTKIVKSEAGLPTPQNPSTLTQDDGGRLMRLASDELDKPFAPVGMVDLFNIPTGAGGERPAVYESPTAPAGDLKDGDLWLGPATTSVAARQLATLSLSDPACAAFRQSVMDEVRKMMAGGKAVPADIDWTPCVKVLGSGQIDARVLNGMIQLRGELVYTMTATGSFSTVQRLPANFPKPPSEQHATVFGYENGVAYRRVFVRFITDGSIAICGDGKITHTSMAGAQAFAY
jgi:hypothetical protein